MSIAEKLIRAKTDYDEVYEAGKQAEYDAFWDAYQDNGNRTNYEHAFMHWPDECYNPKYPIIMAANSYAFQDARFKSTKVDIDISQSPKTYYVFYNTKIETITKLIVAESVVFDGQSFLYSSYLKNITIEGVIGSSIDFKSCPLTKASITSIINALSSSTSGQTCTLKKTAKEAAFTADEWATLIATKSNWTFSLV